MPSLAAKFFNSMIRKTLRKQRWGRDEQELAARARRKFGAPSIAQGLITIGLEVERVGGSELRGEWVSPKDPRKDGIILYIHGGGFVSCSARTHRPITAALARKTKLEVFAIDYRLAPEHRFPAALDDVFAGYKRLKEAGVGKIALGGDSAGGGLVMSLLVRIRDAGLEPPACAVCFSPWADLTSRDESSLNAKEDAMFHIDNVEEFANVYLGEHPPKDPLASPVFADLKNLPPVLLQVSSAEMLLADSQDIHHKIRASGGASKLEIFDDLAHCWQMLNWLVPEAGQALDHAADFISRHICGTDQKSKI